MSLTQGLNANLGLIAVVCSLCVIGIVLYRCIRIVCSIVISEILVINGSSTAELTALKKFANMELLGGLLLFVLQVCLSLLRIVIAAFKSFCLILVGMLPFVVFALVLALVQEQWNHVVFLLADVLNGNLGSTIEYLLLAPLNLLEQVGTYVLPIYNLAVYVFVHFPLTLLMWFMRGDGAARIVSALAEVRAAGSKLALAGESFGNANFLPVGQGCSTCVAATDNTTFCTLKIQNIEMIAQSCLNAAAREMDLALVFGHLKTAAQHSIISLGTSCNAIALVANLTLFPLTDSSLWLGADRLLNFALGVTVIAPSAATMRCSMAGGFLQRPSMCTPDFAPSFAALSKGFQHLGDALTHWLDSLYVLVFDQKTISEACNANADYSALWTNPVAVKMFGRNTTILVRMTSLAFAVTDGVSTMYVTQEPLRWAFAPQSWPFSVNTKFGVARVGLPSGVDVKDGGVGLFGCSCADEDANMMKLQCATITRGGDAWLIGVEWSLAAETQLLTCARTRIVVQSIRWYQPRVSVTMLRPASFLGQQPDQLAADVAVYAIPVCGAQDGVKAMACFSDKTFMHGICFPYCMGLRMLHEGVQPITMRGASEWSRGVIMAMRDCTRVVASSATAAAGVSSTCSIQSDVSGLPSKASGSSDACTQSVTCTSAATNRTQLRGYEPSTFYSWGEKEEGAALVLDGQPLAVAGGVHMRSYQQQTSTLFDFPSLVGNRYNEFTIEANLPLGAPAMPEPQSLLKTQRYVVAPSIAMPPEFVQLGVPYNPGTLSESAFWYATNPSYEWISAFAQYCASKGRDAQTQVMMLSSYVPLRLQRIRYQDGACFVASQTEQHVCAPNLFSSVLIPDALPFMSSSDADASLYDLCLDTRRFNLWVEHVEYFDPANIVIAVRRGVLAELVVPTNTSTIVFYFVRTRDASQIRPHVPWAADDNSSTTLADCPALRVLPNVGAVVGHSLSAVTNLVGVVANLILNPFAIMELLSARAAGVCPENGLSHTSLADCGMGMVSLDPFFKSVYAANTAAWEAFAWLVAALLGSSSGGVAGVFGSFLNGAAIMGDATHVVAMFDIERVVQDGFNTGIQDVLERRRRLLTMGDPSGRSSIMSGLSGGLKMGLRGFFSLTKAIGAVASMSLFGGADFGALLSSQDPRTQLGSSIVTGPPIAWAQFTYAVGVQIVVDVLAALQNLTGEKQIAVSLFAPLWLRIHEAADQYESIVDARLKRACSGLRLMLGYSSSFAETMYYGCMSGVSFPSAVLRLASTVFVDVALYRCLCVYPAGQDYLQYVNSTCLQLIPPTRMALWQETLLAATDGGLDTAGVPGMCAVYLKSVRSQAESLFDEWAFLSRQAAEKLASFLNEILANRQTAAACSNVVGNPTAAVFTPLPITHYKMCGATSDCKARCADAIALFEAAVRNSPGPADAPPSYFNLTAESPFFNRYAAQTASSSRRVLGIATVPAVNGTATCLQRCTSAGRCMAVLYQRQEEQAKLTLSYYCIPDPSMLLSTVFPMGVESIEIAMTEASSVVTHADVLWPAHQNALLIIVYTTRVKTTVSVTQQVTRSVCHEVHLWRAVDESAEHFRLLSSEDDLTADMLTLQVQKGLFQGQTIARPVVSECQITSILPLLIGTGEKRKKLSLLLSFSARIQGFVAGGAVQDSHLIHAILNYPDIATARLFAPENNFFFFVPCPLGCVTATCGGVCNAGLDAAIQLAKNGMLIASEDEEKVFLFLPSATSLEGGKESKFVIMDSVKGLTDSLASFPMLNSEDQSWTRGDIFASIQLSTKLIRDSVYRLAAVKGSRSKYQLAGSLFFQVDPAQHHMIDNNAAAWLQEIRPSLAPRGGFRLLSYKSAQTVVTARVSSKCTYMSCTGCSNGMLRLLCASAQKCVLANCIGTVVQTSNVLCSMGAVMQQTAVQAITTWQAIYAACIEIIMLVTQGMSGANLISGLKFPTDQFYSLVCSCKDMYARVVGLLMGIGRIMSGATYYHGVTSAGSRDMGALVGEDTLKSTSLGGLVFNVVTGGTLLPTLALHRWLLCMANTTTTTASQQQQDGGTLTVQFGDVSMDESWLPCAQMGGLAGVLNADDMAGASENAVQIFVSFVLSMMSGLGETILYGMQLSFDCIIDYVTGLVWNLQDILYSYNLRSCKVPNYAMRYAMQCACGDEAYRIPQFQREQTEGALWCVGTLSMTLADGTYGIIYNPYSLDTLSKGVADVTAYIECLSVSSSSAASCAPPSGENKILSLLVAQGVEPIAVWARCKSNYALSMWDVGAGALFSKTYDDNNIGNANPSSAALILEKAPAAIQWAHSVSPELLACLQDLARLQMDYSSCLITYLSAQNASNPNAYFVYEPMMTTMGNEPPDACLLFSGLVNASLPGSPLNTLMRACSTQEDVGHTTFCDLNALGWSGQQPQKVAVAGLHGLSSLLALTKGRQNNNDYEAPLQNLRQAFSEFNQTTTSSGEAIDAMLFSADGDLIHQFFDCMFLGPYHRIDAMPCDREGQLECPFYARDEEGGLSREFTPCYGAAMHGDEALPYTCGSQARRAIIKYYFRDYSTAVSPGSITSNISKLIKQQVDAIYLNYTDARSFGCGPACLPSDCSFANGYAPCMSTSYSIPANVVGESLIENALGELDAYYAFVHTNTSPWMKYYHDYPARSRYPFQWSDDPDSAFAAQRLSHFDPSKPQVTYGPEEVYSMSSQPETSIWHTCMALVGHPSMSIPLDASTQLPLGIIIQPTKNGGRLDMARLDEAEALIINVTRAAMSSACPFVWHRDRRHAPSVSSACQRNRAQKPPAKLMVGDVTVQTPGTPLTVRPAQGLTFPLYGFLQSRIGDRTCICATADPAAPDQCMLSSETCLSFLSKNSSSVCRTLHDACATTNYYSLEQEAHLVLECLIQEGEGVRCPELGPSDQWGLFPAGCSTQECPGAASWASSAGNIKFDGARFLTEGRGGLRLPNYRHVNDTYHRGHLHYGLFDSNSTAFMRKQSCADPMAQAEIDDDDDDLFPAAQLLFDSPVVAICSRYVIEVSRNAILGTAKSQEQALDWRRRCEAKIRQLARCSMAGVYYDMTPPSLSLSSKCKLSLMLPVLSSAGVVPQAYVTPSTCVVVDRVHRKMYDGPLCAQIAGRSNNVLLSWDDLSEQCLLNPQPLHLLQGDVPYSMVFGAGKTPLSSDWLSNLSPFFDFRGVDETTRQNNKMRLQDHISHVWDWWPQDWFEMPPGYHPTSASDPEEFAPAGFDSHFLYDPETTTFFYAHSVARNGSLLFDTLGAAGVCRAPNVGMPMFNANTNRVCTSMPLDIDTPHLPVSRPKGASRAGYSPETCSASHKDVPWMAQDDDPQSQSVGGIQGWQRHAAMDDSSATLYASSVYPNSDDSLTPLRNVPNGWGDDCRSSWGAAIFCNDDESGEICPAGMTCIYDEGIGGKVCFSSYAAAHHQRQPCFRSQHCPDGLVCLADGGCVRPKLHVWNRLAEDIEIAVVADDCGFPDTRHPYTQSSRGASAWEQVPDLLHVHGFCSHRNWFSYRQALWTQVCPGGVCSNTSGIRWPWIFERFDLERADLAQSMAAARTLLSMPHACDESYMHLQDPQTKRRLQVCSGNQGHQERPVEAYNLSSSEQGAATAEEPRIARWLRTYDEETDALHLGVFGDDLANDVPLGFLGASASLGGVMGDMARGAEKVHFFRCGDRLACSNPSFTYNGRTVERLDPATLSGNFSEVSLRRCGAMGFLATDLWKEEENHDICWLEIEFFPVLMQLLWGQEDSGCPSIWTRGSSASFLSIVDVPQGFQGISSAVIHNSPSSFFCEPKEGGRCAYAARATTRITSSHQQDSVVQLASALNHLLETTADAVIALAKIAGPTRTYEHINRCAAQLMFTVTVAQAPMQAALNSWGPSGIYYSLLVTLYEIPIAWLHHAMLVSLLSSIDPSVPKPPLETMMKAGAVPLFLWSEEDKGSVCRTESLDSKPLLWTILCKNIHPAYTFEIDPANRGDPDAFVQNVYSKVMNDIRNEMPGALGNTPVQCYTKAAWPQDCKASCQSAMITAYNSTACHDAVVALSPPWLDPCRHPELFRLLEPRSVIIEALNPPAGSTGIDQYLQAILQRLMDAAARVVNPVEYITEASAASQEEDSFLYVPVARVWPDYLSSQKAAAPAGDSFNFSDWLQHGICASYLDPHAVCTTQYDLDPASSSCLYPMDSPPDETNRYLSDSSTGEPVVTIVYLSGGTDEIRVCDIPNKNNGGEVCFVQHSGTSDMYMGLKNSDIVPCDIASIEAPPGVEVQAFAISESLEHWWASGIISDACGPSGLTCPPTACVPYPPFVASCSWRSSADADPTYPTWNAGTRGLDQGEGGNSSNYYLDGFGPLKQDFTRMKDWWRQHSEWHTLGCGDASAVCAIRIRLEQTPNTRGICGHQGILSGPRDSTLLDPPNCKLIMNDMASSPFRIAQGTSSALYRCAPCTLASNLVAPAAPAPTYFGCFLDSSSSVSFDLGATQLIERYLDDPLALLAMFSSQQKAAKKVSYFNGTAIDILAPLVDSNPSVSGSLLRWGKPPDASSASSCYASAPAGCWAGYDINYAATDDMAVWGRAIQNPGVEFTMTCGAQRYTQDDAERCNPATNGRRALLSDFVQAQYRETDGVWMHVVPANTGIAWPANVAHSRVGMFSLLYASARRSEQQVLTRWILGDGPCRSEPTAIQDRICVESTDSPGPFQPMHPWLGGDFNPFHLLDECQSTGSLCPCACSPRASCDAKPFRNYSAAFMASEFPELPGCLQQSYPQIRTMQNTDQSNLCDVVKKVSTATTCQHNQDLFGGSPDKRPVTSDELHGEGVPTSQADFLVQGMYDSDGALLWAGQTLLQQRRDGAQKYAFLRMQREYLHPAHIAFAHNLQLTAQPLVIASIRLLIDKTPFSGEDVSWVAALQQNWAADAAAAAALYPQLSSAAVASSSSWSCPLRAVAFWGGGSPSFSPLIPHPPFAALLYKELKGAHPLIQTRSIAEHLAAYSTTNGACFYDTSSAIIRVDVSDTQNPCGLYATLRSLLNSAATMSAVMNSFAGRCNQILDAPDLPSTLRSGERTTAQRAGTCGVLHRLTPFKMRIKGDAALVTRLPSLTTRSEGGDCHMGRMLVASISDRLRLSGAQCALLHKNSTHATAACPLDSSSSRLHFRRVAPLALSEILNKQNRRYRMQGLVRPKFVGPGGVTLQDAEFSFGLLHSTSLRSTLAKDLAQQGCRWQAEGDFISKYAAAEPSAFNCSSSPPPAPAPITTSTIATNASLQDEALWNASDWAWSTPSSKTKNTGTVNKQAWLKNRYSACHDSYSKEALLKKKGMAVKPITLCEPSPTPQLQLLCKAMLQFRTDVANVNCQLKGGCLYKPGAFYVPYMWSATNQEFAADTVNAYYESIVRQPRFSANESFALLCPARNALMQHLVSLSRLQAQQCPANQIEYLKNILKTVKMVGNDLLYMGYCLGMYCINVLAAVFAGDAFSLSSMMQLANTYLGNFLETAARIIMPILNMLVRMIFGTSSFGKILGEALNFLCEAYNFIMDKFIVPSWCAIIRPAIHTILESIRSLVSLASKEAANQIENVASALVGNGVDPKNINSCLGNSLKVALQCGDVNKLLSDDNGNASEFLTQSLATRCWSDSSAGSVLGGGISAATYLSCTASDTCALEPLGFDDRSSLIACASCPAPATAYAKAFGCDTYLSRCTCGVQRGTPAACATTSDCTSNINGICAVSSHLETVGMSTSMASMACSQCGSVIGMLPTCVQGTCACANAGQAGVLQPCSIPGQPVPLLLQANGMCLASRETFSPSLVQQPGIQDWTLDLSTLELVSCSMGVSKNLCLNVQLPLASGGGQYAKPFVVIFMGPQQQQQYTTGGGGRRLLAWSNEVEERSSLEKAFRFNESSAFCQNAWRLQLRSEVKWCLHWHMVSRAADPDEGRISLFVTSYAAFATMAKLAWRGNMSTLSLVLDEYPPSLIKSLMMMMLYGGTTTAAKEGSSSSSSSTTFPTILFSTTPQQKKVGGEGSCKHRILLVPPAV